MQDSFFFGGVTFDPLGRVEERGISRYALTLASTFCAREKLAIVLA